MVWIAFIEVVACAILTGKYGTGVRGVGSFVLLSVVGILLWVLFVMPTRCDFEVRGRGCRRKVYGKARGCHDHGQAKRDAMFAALGMRNPGMAVRVMWLDGPQGGRRSLGGSTPEAATAASTSNRGQALYNLTSLCVAIVAAVAGVLALFVAK